ncbi:MAG: hypothetical protein IKU19_04290 [Clostridia bacterium]|nr:hypothetical protein [Clostridia bacterium]
MKNFMIFGDSYSTFHGYIPEHYAAYYWQEPDPCHGLNRLEQTWWHQLMRETNSNIVVNNSWSGSTVGYTGYEGENTEVNSFIARLEKYIAEGFFEDKDIDTVFIFGGTNDCWCGAEVGEVQYDNFEKSDLYRVLPAVCYMIKRTKEALPDAKIYWLINTELTDSITEGIKAACRHYDIEYVAFEHIKKVDGHPTPVGMTEIKNEIMKHLFA